MKLTDEKVAKMISFEKRQTTGLIMNYWVDANGTTFKSLPPYTTSIDAITEAIESRGLKWEHSGPYSSGGYKEVHSALVLAQGCVKDSRTDIYYSQKAPLALCAAFVAYLKEVKK